MSRAWSRSSVRRTLVAVPLLGALLTGAPAAADSRSQVLFERSCHSDRGRQVVTLFGNGTIRLKETAGEGDPALHIAELAPEDTDRLRRQLQRELPSDGLLGEDGSPVIEGMGVEVCTLLVDTGRGRLLEHEYSPLSSPSLRLQRWLGFAEDLVQRARPPEDFESLDEDYVPSIGDVLRDRAGQRFLIRWITFEGLVELDGIDTPVHVRIASEELGEHFVSQVEAPDS